MFLGRNTHRVLDFKKGIRPQQTPIPTSQIAQHILDQTVVIYKDVRKDAMQAYITDKVHYDKKANASNFKNSEYVRVLQPKAGHQGCKIRLTKIRCIGTYYFENVLPNKNFLLLKFGTNKTQMLHRMRLRQLTFT